MRRLIVVGVTAGLVLSTLSLSVGQQPNADAATPAGQRLRTLAVADNLLFGYASINNFDTISDGPQYRQTAIDEFNLLTPENALKFDSVHPQETTFSFTAPDTHINFALANGMTAHGHVLIWHSQLPAWVTGRSWTSAQLTTMMNTHIDTVMGHYVGKVSIWDVVNEAFNDDGTLRSSLWQNTIPQSVPGGGFIEQAFRRARAADPNAVLVYNDFNIEPTNAKSDAVFRMVSDFKSRGVPIDGIGLQMHLTNGGISASSLRANMQRFASLGVNIYISEFDIRLPVPTSANDLNTTQPNIYRTVVTECLAQPACKAITTWGFTDAHSWVPGAFSGQGAALEFDANYAAKPAYFAIQSALAAGRPGGPTSTPTVTVVTTATPTRTPIISSPTATPTRTSTLVAATGTPTGTPVSSTGASCTITYALANQWNTTPTSGGFQVNLSIANNTTRTINGWSIGWVFPSGQSVQQLWNAAFTQAGPNVTVTSNQSWNSTIAPHATVTGVGFSGAWSGNNARPTTFTLNGVACSAA